MSNIITTIFSGQDIDFLVDLGLPFSSTQEIEAIFYNDGIERKVLRKNEAVEAKRIIPIAGKPNQCRLRVFKPELNNWVDGYVHIGLAVTMADAGFPQGRTDKYYGLIAKFEKLP